MSYTGITKGGTNIVSIRHGSTAITKVYFGANQLWPAVYHGLGVSSITFSPASPYSYTQDQFSGGTPASATAVASGGTPPYTYLWAKASGDPTFNIISGSTTNTVTVGDSLSGYSFHQDTLVLNCTASDANTSFTVQFTFLANGQHP
jgi:hypothetical protein